MPSHCDPFLGNLESDPADVQAFKNRFSNFLQYLMVRVLVMGSSSAAERELSQRFGYQADGCPLRHSTAPAVISPSDWALENPFPMPPKVHVRLHQSSVADQLIAARRSSCASCHLVPNQASNSHDWVAPGTAEGCHKLMFYQMPHEALPSP